MHVIFLVTVIINFAIKLIIAIDLHKHFVHLFTIIGERPCRFCLNFNTTLYNTDCNANLHFHI